MSPGGSPWPGGIWKPGPDVYDEGVDSNVSFRMSDGTLLAGDVAYPLDRSTGERAAGEFPVVVTMNPYWAMFQQIGANPDHLGNLDYELAGLGGGGDSVNYLVQRGYIRVTFDARGTGRSHGDFTFLGEEQLRDLVEIAEHLATNLPNSNGSAALAGLSYMGLSALAAGRHLRRGSPIKAIFAAAAGTDPFRALFNQGGIPTHFGLCYAQLEQYRNGGIAPGYGEDAESGGPMSRDGEFWQSRDPIDAAEAIVAAGVPVLMVSGAGDFAAMASLRMYTALQNAAQGRSIWEPMDPGLAADGRYHLVWGTLSDNGPPLMYDWSRYQLQWFDTFLKREETSVEKMAAPLHLYEWQSKRWVNAASYPLTRSYTRLYLTEGSTSFAPHAMNDGGLAAAATTATDGADSLEWAAPAKPPASSQASNVLAYTSEPFADGALLAGPINARLYASTDVSDVMLVATLLDVAPDGEATAVYRAWQADGALLGSARSVDPSRSWYDDDGGLILAHHVLTEQAREPVEAGQTIAMDVTLSPRMWAVLPGHRLRLQVTTQAPQLLVLMAPQVESLRGGTFSIARNAEHPSSINLPLLPLDAFAASTGWAQRKYADEPYPGPDGQFGPGGAPYPLAAPPFSIPRG